MTQSLRLVLLDAVVAALNDDPNSDIPIATTRRWSIGDDALLPTISCWVATETIRRAARSARFGGPEERSLRINVQAINSTPEADRAEEVLDEVVRHIEARLGNTTLEDGAHSVLIDRIMWEVIKGDALYCVATVECLIEYQTKRGDSTRAQ